MPELYRLASPVTHVGDGCPPTFLIQGSQDIVTPIQATHDLADKLRKNGVPCVNLVLPWTAHGFDLVFPRISPPAQSAIYDIDRFLAVIAES